tara:strand:- start:464 stop:652 length:189 start_codon:yes stop_codon:yes gene_type:complete
MAPSASNRTASSWDLHCGTIAGWKINRLAIIWIYYDTLTKAYTPWSPRLDASEVFSLHWNFL